METLVCIKVLSVFRAQGKSNRNYFAASPPPVEIVCVLRSIVHVGQSLAFFSIVAVVLLWAYESQIIGEICK